MPVKADNKAVLRDDRNADCTVLSILTNGRASIEWVGWILYQSAI